MEKAGTFRMNREQARLARVLARSGKGAERKALEKRKNKKQLETKDK